MEGLIRKCNSALLSRSLLPQMDHKKKDRYLGRFHMEANYFLDRHAKYFVVKWINKKVKCTHVYFFANLHSVYQWVVLLCFVPNQMATTCNSD
jgi:hypothetical protein